MEPTYRYSESTTKPLSIEIKTDCVYLRNDIAKDVRTDSFGNSVTYWTYQEAFLTTKEFNEYVDNVAAKNTIEGTNNANNIIDILTNQVAGGDNQLAIMEAIADLYDAIATLG